MGTGDGLVGGEGNGLGVGSRVMISPSGEAAGLGKIRGVGLTRGGGLTRGVGLTFGIGRGVGVAAWEVLAVAIIANVKVAKTVVIAFVNLILGFFPWWVRDNYLRFRVRSECQFEGIGSRIFLA
jgi:hypothetical protein